jgi:hypothetical protein
LRQFRQGEQGERENYSRASGASIRSALSRRSNFDAFEVRANPVGANTLGVERSAGLLQHLAALGPFAVRYCGNKAAVSRDSAKVVQGTGVDSANARRL